MTPEKIKEIFNLTMDTVKDANIFGVTLEASRNLELAVRSVVSLSGKCDQKEIRGLAQSMMCKEKKNLLLPALPDPKSTGKIMKARDYLQALRPDDSGLFPDAFIFTGEVNIKEPFAHESGADVSCFMHLRRNGAWTTMDLAEVPIAPDDTPESCARKMAAAFDVLCPDLESILAKAMKGEKEGERVILFLTVGEGEDRKKIADDIRRVAMVGRSGLSSLPRWVLDAFSTTTDGESVKIGWHPDKVKKLHDTDFKDTSSGVGTYCFEGRCEDVEKGIGAVAALAHLVPEIVGHYDSSIIVTGVAVGNGNQQMALSFAADKSGVNYDVINAENNADQLLERQRTGMRM